MNTNIPKELLATNETQVRRKSENWMSVYANHFSLSLGMDTKLHFGKMSDEDEDGKTIANEEIEIIMTKELTKILWILLGQHLEAYENQIGEIVLPALANNNRR